VEKGVLVGADEAIAWLLPWWWERYIASNNLPVAFIDFGMEEKTRQWCEERGRVIPFQEDIEGEVLPIEIINKWKKSYGESYERMRSSWFKKPVACLLTPFKQTVWIDLDCEILSSIEGVFSFLTEGKELAAALETETNKGVNGGVVVFQQGSSLVRDWNALAKRDRGKYWGDDRVLSEVIKENLERFSVLPDGYNWRISQGVPLHAKIIHWCGQWGKIYIKEHGGLKGLIEKGSILEKVMGAN
jgi:hypothetical protein